jgi:hypothetical protein
MDDPVWSATRFSKNRQRLLDGAVAQAFFVEVKVAAAFAGLLSAEHFTVDGTLLEAYASLRSFQPKGRPTPPRDNDDPGNPTVDFGGQCRSNQTHQLTIPRIAARFARPTDRCRAWPTARRCSWTIVTVSSSTRPRPRGECRGT